MLTGATLSDCGRYRYQLWRAWGDGPSCVFVMLNPSTADAEKDDPTIRRCIGFAKREGCGSLNVVNLFAFRATKPKDMMAAADPIGPENDEVIAAALRDPGAVKIAAWGTKGAFMGRGAQVRAKWRGSLKCLGQTKDGHPLHPLYVPADKPLEAFAALMGER